MVISNLPFDEWTEVFGSQRLTGAQLDRLKHLLKLRQCRHQRHYQRHALNAVVGWFCLIRCRPKMV